MRYPGIHQAAALLCASFVLTGLWSWVVSGYNGHMLTVAYMGCGLLLFYNLLRRQNRIGEGVYVAVLIVIFFLLFMPLRMSFNAGHQAGVFRMGFLIVVTGLAIAQMAFHFLRTAHRTSPEDSTE